jgi:trimethylamine--corrinoid protein Co-methyltransferase
MGPGTEPSFWTGAALNYVTGKDSRPITCDDLAQFTRLTDALETPYAIVGTALQEIPPAVRDVVGLRVMAFNTSKHLRPLLFSPSNVKAMCEIAQVIADGRAIADVPLISFGYSCLSPLHWTRTSIDMWKAAAPLKAPIMLNGEPVSGSTSPVTLAGSLSLSNAEILAGVVLVQMIEPGAPVVHNLGFAHVTDMRTAGCVSGSAECTLMAAAGAQLAASWELPCASWMCTDAFADDQQATLEKVLTGFPHLLAGVNIVWGMGQLESQKAISPVQLVIDDEIVRGLKRFRRGFDVDEDTLAFEAIREVVEEGQAFLAHDHTFAHFRKTLSESPLLLRTVREKWVEEGSTDLADRAAAYVEDVMSQPPPDHLSEEQKKAIIEIEERELKRAR